MHAGLGGVEPYVSCRTETVLQDLTARVPDDNSAASGWPANELRRGWAALEAARQPCASRSDHVDLGAGQESAPKQSGGFAAPQRSLFDTRRTWQELLADDGPAPLIKPLCGLVIALQDLINALPVCDFLQLVGPPNTAERINVPAALASFRMGALPCFNVMGSCNSLSAKLELQLCLMSG